MVERIVNLTCGEEGAWFEGSVERALGNGKDTYFWEGVWVGEESLKVKFSKLYHLSRDKEAKVGI